MPKIPKRKTGKSRNSANKRQRLTSHVGDIFGAAKYKNTIQNKKIKNTKTDKMQIYKYTKKCKKNLEAHKSAI